MNPDIRNLIAKIYAVHMRDHTATADFEVCGNTLCKLAYAAERDLNGTQGEQTELRDIARAVVMLESTDGGRSFPSKSLIERARAALKGTE